MKSLVKLALQSRSATIGRVHGPERIIIMGNGPSLKDTIRDRRDWLMSMPRMAVNFAANAPEYHELKPEYYILVDPHFFSGRQEPNLIKLWEQLRSTDWPLTLIVPCQEQAQAKKNLDGNTHVTVATINALGIEGWQWLENWAYSSGRGMPRPRNVLIPAIMSAIQMGCKQIWIVGADHSWLKTLWVDDANHVVSVQPHFYADDQKERQRIATEYEQYPLHQILGSMVVAFEAYHRIQRYASTHSISIINSTPDSYIDAFPREMKNEK
ncbi:MAG: hypothetical protein LIP03_12170 [Bacteroidales bacterium]|nr:hypothetical protein [Bacteroidales bacterium]